jgi:nicotinate-nucleotide pyrophosphorylase (carboxylating)
MNDIDRLLSFVREDAPFGDITSESILGAEWCVAVITAKDGGIISGLEEASSLFQYFGVRTSQEVQDGDSVTPGMVIMTLEGAAKSILLVERTALNLIGRMSGIATKTKRFADLLKEQRGCRIAATRKTAPGLRALDKKAVIAGGGDPHRMSLSDGVLIKDNHVALVPLKEAIFRAKSVSHYRKVEVEVPNQEAAVEAAESGADILLLDNMSPETVKATIELLEEKGLRKNVLLEISGNITEKNVSEYIIPGIDLISSGSLTKSVTSLDVSLDIVPKTR